jgi:hypothetical protein
MLLGADQFIDIVRDYRLVWIRGRYSGFKTSFAVYLAETYLKKGYRLISNARTVWNDTLEDVQLLENGMLRAVMLLDEGGLYFKAGKQLEEIAAYSAKMDCIYIFPSFFPPVKAAQVVTVQPVYSYRRIGIPLVKYEWNVRLGNFNESGKFFWLFPQEIYGLYSRQDPGANPDAIKGHLVAMVEQFKEKYGHGGGDGIREMESEISTTDILSDVAQSFSETADRWETLSTREAKRRRRR